jgi:hypothetical protein
MYSAIATFFPGFYRNVYKKNILQGRDNTYLTLIVPGEVKFDFADFDVKLQKIYYVLFFLKPGQGGGDSGKKKYDKKSRAMVSLKGLSHRIDLRENGINA